MAKYDFLDSMIIAQIKGGCDSFADIYFGSPGSGNKGVYLECCNLVVGSQEPARVLDRRLQALRKKGLIECDKKGWKLTSNT